MIGKTISKYKVIERIGAGAMGEVYKAEDTELRRPVALKFLSREMTLDETYAKRFMREAQAASALDHPNVCTIYEINHTRDKRMYIAMAYCDGLSLREQLAKGLMDVGSAVGYALGVADCLAQAHRKGIIHRDIKPANLVVTGESVVKVLDFGLAKLAGRSQVTSSGTTLGTLSYMSPEQAKAMEVDNRSDIFSLGVTLYEMLTGESPFYADNEAAVVYKILNVDPTPVCELRSEVSEDLERVVTKAMEKNPEDRYQSMEEFRDELFDVLHAIEPSRAMRFESFRRTGKRQVKKRSRLMWPSVLAAIVLVAVVLNWSSIKRILGFGGVGDSKGIAVLQLDASSVGAGGNAFAKGLAVDLTSRIQRLSEFDPDLWVVPDGRVRNAGIDDPARALKTFGVDAVIVGSVSETEDAYGFELRLVDPYAVRPLAVFESSTDDYSWQKEMYEWIAGVLEVEMDSTQVGMLTAGDPGDWEASGLVVVGLGYLTETDPVYADSALMTFGDALLIEPEYASAHVGHARALYRKNRQSEGSGWVDDAVSSCRAALEIDSLRGDAYRTLSNIHANVGENDQAVEDLLRAIRVNPRDSRARHDLAFTYLRNGRYDKTEQMCRAAIVANPSYWGGYEDLGYVCYVLGKYDEAIAQFEKAAELTPDFGPNYNYLGALYYIKERWPEAIANFEKSFALKKNYEACANLGTLYYMEGRFADAARMYEWALEYHPSDHLVVGNLAVAYYYIPAERERAAPLFEKAITLARAKLAETPGDAGLMAVLAGYYSIDHPDSAVYFAEQALAIAPDDSEVLFRAAGVYEQIDERPRALVLLGDALANGYSLKVVENEEQFVELRKDPRYALLVAEAKESKDD